MGRYSVRKCKEIIGEVAETGEKMTRARLATSAWKKRKVDCGGALSYPTSLVQLRSRRRLSVTPENSTENAASNSNDPCASCCSSNGSSELDNDTSEFVDLEEESVERATSTNELESCRERREATPSCEVQAESGELESTARPPSSSEANSRRRSVDEKMPSKAELEEFFSAAEKKLHRQFAEKYNFDFVKEEPLEGRYEWVPVKP